MTNVINHFVIILYLFDLYLFLKKKIYLSNKNEYH